MSSDQQLDDRTDRSDFSIPRMDCPSEERSVRLALEGLQGVRSLAFDLPERKLTVWHSSEAASEVARHLDSLRLGATLLGTRAGVELPENDEGKLTEARTLWVLLAINGAMFVAELFSGGRVQSTGLIADSLDMLADALVYGLSLYAVGRTARNKVRAAHFSGYLQLVLALGALFEVTRRFIHGNEPEPVWMLGVATLALVANVACLVLVSRHRKGGAHMKASYIFSTNDVLANVGVITAGALVGLTRSPYPDLVAGFGIALLVASGAVRILRIKS